MLFVPDEDYVRLPDHTSVTTINTASTTSTTDTAAAADDDDDDDDDGDDNGEGDDGGGDDVKDEEAEDGPVSPSLLFASQSQYLGHSNQVQFSSVTEFMFHAVSLFVCFFFVLTVLYHMCCHLTNKVV